jgi:hypothetical protein
VARDLPLAHECLVAGLAVHRNPLVFRRLRIASVIAIARSWRSPAGRRWTSSTRRPRKVDFAAPWPIYPRSLLAALWGRRVLRLASRPARQAQSRLNTQRGTVFESARVERPQSRPPTPCLVRTPPIRRLAIQIDSNPRTQRVCQPTAVQLANGPRTLGHHPPLLQFEYSSARG